ncbi:hypothetical protein [Sorangium sp. So ce1389]|uniref:hypothetical protein n=1 Tax=Sorangium sp. So ce1389 TaxID=3133336 RepID=UPI003F60252F
MKASEWLQGKTLADLNAVELGGRLLFPDTIKRCKRDGSFEEVPVMVRVPRQPELLEARVQAAELFRAKKLDRDRDQDVFEQFETLCILSKALRDAKPPHDQHAPVEWLISGEPGKGYDLPSLMEVWEHIRVYQELIDPRITEPTTEDVVAAVMAIDRVRNLSPLAGIAGSALDSFVISMAVLLASYLRSKPSSPSSETSTPAS